MPRAAVDSTERIFQALAAADLGLRRLWGDPDAPVPEEAPVASMPETVDRLVRTIAQATSEDWYRRRRSEGVSAAEMVWLALHDAVHSLEDAELAWAQLSAPLPASEGEDLTVGAWDLLDGAVVPMSLVSLYGGDRPPGSSDLGSLGRAGQHGQDCSPPVA